MSRMDQAAAAAPLFPEGLPGELEGFRGVLPMAVPRVGRGGRDVGCRNQAGRQLPQPREVHRLHQNRLHAGGQTLLALGVGAVRVDHPHHHVVDGDVGGDRRVAFGELLENEHGISAGKA